MQDSAIEIDLIPTKVYHLGCSEPMPEGNQDHGGIAVAIAVLPSRSHERLDLMLSQVFATAQIAVPRAPRHDCSFFDGRRDQRETRISHGKSPVHCSYC